ncbi:hypothetical protein ACVWYH_009840 [Bradyrhizobium sp. GM24.11]|jgi:hypothetical protein
MKRTGFVKADCPVARALDAIGDWWSLLIVRDAFDGLRRFGDFQKNLGIAKGMSARACTSWWSLTCSNWFQPPMAARIRNMH